MGSLNHFLISQALGSRMVPSKRPAFGHFGAMHAVADMLKTRSQVLCDPADRDFTHHEDLQIVKAFEETRGGYSPDNVLVDPVRATDFLKRSRELGVKAPDAAILRRVMRFRKSPPAGIKLTKSTARYPKHNHTPYLYAAELAAKRLSYLRGASVDDLLIYPDLGEEFDRMASQLAPGWTAIEYRLAALYVRKVVRVCDEKHLEDFAKLSLPAMERKLKTLGSLADLKEESVPRDMGIFVLTETVETPRDLYIMESPDLFLGVAPFRNQKVFDLLANHFWEPKLDKIQLQIVTGATFAGQSMKLWELKLIQARSPIFNLPV